MRSDSKYRKILEIFLATPGNLLGERRAVEEVVDTLNQPGGVADEKNVLLRLLDGSDPAPDGGLPQQVILDQLPVERWDIVIVILRGRFGRRTGGVNPETEEPFESGTEEEFITAYRAWQKTERPRILAYRGEPQEDDPKQNLRVQQFWDECEQDGAHPLLYRRFIETEELRLRLVQDLTAVIHRICEGQDSEEDGSASATEPVPMSMLRVDVAGHDQLLKSFGKTASHLMDSFKRWVQRITRDLGGIVLSWDGDGDGAIIAFMGHGRQYLALRAGLSLFQRRLEFQVDRAQNPGRIPIELRLAAHDGLVPYEPSLGSVRSCAAINLLLDLEGQAQPGELCITGDLFHGLEPDLKRLFAFRGPFAGGEVFVYPESRRECPPSSEARDDLLSEAREVGAFLVISLDSGGDHPSRSEIEAIRRSLDTFYDAMGRFCSWFAADDEHWSPELLEEAKISAGLLLTVDREICEAFERRQSTLPAQGAGSMDLDRLMSFLAARRSRTMVRLKRLQDHLKGPAGELTPGLAALDGPSWVALDKAERLLATQDDLEREELFADLSLHHRPDLVSLVSGSDIDTALLDQMWQRADIILIDDFQMEPRRPWNVPGALFGTLVTSPVDPGRFRTVRDWLKSRDRLSPEAVRRRFEENGSPGDRRELQVLVRSLLVAHPSSEIRRQAAELADPQDLWLLLTHPELPLRVILEVALRFTRTRDLDLLRLLFDCCRARIATALAKGSPAEANALRTLLLLFHSSEALVEEGYWERLEGLYQGYVELAARLGSTLDQLESRRRLLSERRTARVLPFRRRSSPAFIATLPESVQLHVAREGAYLDQFVVHLKDRIALATYPHLAPRNLTQLLDFPFNEQLLHKLWEEKSYCGQRPFVVKILNQKKCPIPFAEKYIRVLTANEALLLSSHPEARPEVRALARRRLAR